MKNRRQETMEIIEEIRSKGHSLEEIAFWLEKSYGAVWNWAKGKRNIDKGDFELLKKIKGEICLK